ncbi:DUF4442 domain-containing protein [Caulobacter sp. CCUG 60055]|uniref:DUF4442 domain-containing protein n=2 Tax=Pseudomonadota TaxID=1224 RepID=UPI001FA6C182|nr:DUF4442 domain-containing protein [Caulobacter sp. CCUG 60055]MBQ1542502.1 DUF4442 domain-containing protein [Caulobacteraceae bacterium]MCI3179594.1 DUF4442 domain-containing protein [Caulobacter sp. CCUG 60055]
MDIDLGQFVPFVGHLHIASRATTGGASAHLADAEHLRNHLGSIHAGALFTLGETASGAALVGHLGDLLGGSRVVTRSASIAYERIAHGDLEAEAVFRMPAVDIRTALARDGRVQFDLDVTLRDGAEQTVATMVVTWNAQARTADRAQN